MGQGTKPINLILLVICGFRTSTHACILNLVMISYHY